MRSRFTVAAYHSPVLNLHNCVQLKPLLAGLKVNVFFFILEDLFIFIMSVVLNVNIDITCVHVPERIEEVIRSPKVSIGCCEARCGCQETNLFLCKSSKYS